MYSDDSDEVKTLVEAMKKSTGDAQMELEEAVIDGKEPLKFVISNKGKLDALKQKFGVANGGSKEHTSEKFSASEEVLRNGIDGEVDAPNDNHYWFNIKLEDGDRINISLTTERGGSDYLGQSHKVINHKKTTIVMPALALSIKEKKGDYHIEAIADAQILLRKTSGLIMHPEQQEKEYIIFDADGAELARQHLERDEILRDARSEEADDWRSLEKLTFYLGEENSVCFSLGDYQYCYKEDMNGDV